MLEPLAFSPRNLGINTSFRTSHVFFRDRFAKDVETEAEGFLHPRERCTLRCVEAMALDASGLHHLFDHCMHDRRHRATASRRRAETVRSGPGLFGSSGAHGNCDVEANLYGLDLKRGLGGFVGAGICSSPSNPAFGRELVVKTNKAYEIG